MGWRFSRRVSIIPGLRVNLGKHGASLSIGHRGAWYTVGPRGRRVTVGDMDTYNHRGKTATPRRDPRAPVG